MADAPDERLGKLTQRLDHMVPDPKLTFHENRAATAQLASLSAKLQDVLPDESLSPFERLERLARAVEDREPRHEHLEPAATKVAALKERLDELVPGSATPEQKVDALVAKLDDLVAEDQRDLPPGGKLETLGDPRGRIEPER